MPLSIEEVKGLPKEKGAGITTEELLGKLSEAAYETSERHLKYSPGEMFSPPVQPDSTT